MEKIKFDPNFNQRRTEKEVKRRKWCEEHNQNYSPICENIQELKEKIYDALKRSDFKACIIDADDCYCHLVGYVIFSEDNETKKETIWGHYSFPAEKIVPEGRKELQEWIKTICPHKEIIKEKVNATCDDFSMLAHYYHND